MLKTFQALSLIAATLTVGSMAGLFTSFSYATMPGLARTNDRTFVDSMQRINVAILNPWFGLCFGGALVFTAIAAVLHLAKDGRGALPWIIAALVLYIAVLAVTFIVNVPLNNELNDAGDPDRITDLHAVREKFEATWNRWNLIRGLLNTTALGFLAWALIQHGRDLT